MDVVVGCGFDARIPTPTRIRGGVVCGRLTYEAWTALAPVWRAAMARLMGFSQGVMTRAQYTPERATRLENARELVLGTRSDPPLSLEPLRYFRRLETFQLTQCTYVDNGRQDFSILGELECLRSFSLRLYGDSMHDVLALDAMASAQHLESLSLYNVRTFGVEPLAALRQLRALAFYYNSGMGAFCMSPSSLESLGGLRKLTRVEMWGEWVNLPWYPRGLRSGNSCAICG